MQTAAFTSSLGTASTFLSGKRLAARPSSRASAPRAMQISAILKARPAKGAVAKAPAKKLVAGKDIKAQQFKVGEKTVSLGFTKSNELFVSRAAMIGIATSIIGELLTGKGALQQLGFETGLPIQDLDGLVLFIIAFNLIAALLPAKGTFVPDEEELTQRPKGALQDSKVSLATPGKFFGGIKGLGFTKANELFAGRLAQLGFAASLIGEGVTGKGILGQLNVETGIPLKDVDAIILVFGVVLPFLAAINEGSGKFVDED
ncbi:g10830 [Coccomyxa elongata]